MRNPWVAAAVGGGIGGLLDIVYAMVTWGVVLAPRTQMTPVGVLQSVASGLLGKQAYQGGFGSAALGLALHFCIAYCMALAYVLAARRVAVLTARPVLMGLLYGVVLYLVMNFIVVPLSAIGWRTPTLRGALIALLPHVVLVGPAIAWAARKGTAPFRTDSRPIS
jgi:uncharacterized membrane protein YagU involved in acid resistance